MKITFFLAICFALSNLSFTQVPFLECPNSPNCISTTSKQYFKKKAPMFYTGSKSEAITAFKAVVLKMKGVKLVYENKNQLKYEFTTGVGKFTDDVEFYFDNVCQKIHFRSSSRSGYSDLGANNRRIRKIKKRWKLAQSHG